MDVMSEINLLIDEIDTEINLIN